MLGEIRQTYKRWMGEKRGDLVHLLPIAHHFRANHKRMRVIFNEADTTHEVSKDTFEILEPFLLQGQLRMVSVEFLMNNVRGMRIFQARELVIEAVNYYRFSVAGKENAFLMLGQLRYMKAYTLNCKKALTHRFELSSMVLHIRLGAAIPMV